MEHPPKIVFVGDTKMGKTTYAYRLLGAEVPDEMFPTLGVEVHQIKRHGIIYNVWDCAGNPRFMGLSDGYYIQADGAIIFATSLDQIAGILIAIRRVCEKIPFVIVDPTQEENVVDHGQWVTYSSKSPDAFDALTEMIQH